VPTLANGGVSEDLTTITWKLKPGLVWSDGTPVTSADVVFSYEYCTHPEGGCSQAARYEGIQSVEALDDMTVKVTFTAPKPNPYNAFVGSTSPIIQKAQFANCLGAAAQQCTDANFGPIGTGPFKVTEFKPNDVISMEANPNYRDPAKPATRRRRAVPSSRPASSTMPGTCSLRPTCLRAWKPPARARSSTPSVRSSSGSR